jgi:hypothetical protein
MTNLASTGSDGLWDSPDYSPLPRARKPARRAVAIAVALALLGAMASAAAAEPEPLTGAAAIADSLRDRTFYGSYVADGEPWTEYYAPDGRSAFALRGCVYRGKWWAAGGRACFSYPELEAGDISCFAVARHDGAMEFSLDGADGLPVVAARTRSIAAGNAEHLPLDVGACLGM